MPFKTGNRANPLGRPKQGYSLAEAIRLKLAKDHRLGDLLEMVIGIALQPHDNLKARMLAAEWLARHGWPGEQGGRMLDVTPTTRPQVTHQHLPALPEYLPE